MRPLALARRAWVWFESLDARRSCLLIFLIGIFVRMGLSLALGTYMNLARYEMERAAISLARTGRLADPYLIPTGYTAHVTPGYAVVLAAIFQVFGTGYVAELVKNLCSSMAASAQYALLPAVAPAFGIARRAGLAAGVFGAVLPIKYATEVMGDWEATFAGLALVLLLYVMASGWRRGRPGARRGALEGLGWGAALLISPALLPVFGAALVLGFFYAWVKAGTGRYAAYAAASVLTVTLCLIPWAWRNEVRLGAPIFTRSNFGLELRLSNNDFAGPLEPTNYKRGVYNRFHPLQSLREAEAVRSMGEVAYNRDRFERGLLWIRSHPERFANLTAWRILYTWFPDTTVPGRDLLLWSITCASALGLWGLWRSERWAAALLAASMASYTAVFAFIHVTVRHRYPVDWILLLTGAAFAARMAERLGSRRGAAAAGLEAHADSHK